MLNSSVLSRSIVCSYFSVCSRCYYRPESINSSGSRLRSGYSSSLDRSALHLETGDQIAMSNLFGEEAANNGGVFDCEEDVYRVATSSRGPTGQLPLTAEDLLARPSGDVFGWTQDVGMGWNPAELRRPGILILSTQGGIRLPDGPPLALGYHTGHCEVGLLMQAAAEELRRAVAFLSQVTAQILATVGRKGRRACSTVFRIVTTRRSSCGA